MIELKRLRQEKKLSMAKLAKLVGVAESTVQRWEAGIISPRFKHYIKLKEVLGDDLEKTQGSDES